MSDDVMMLDNEGDPVDAKATRREAQAQLAKWEQYARDDGRRTKYRIYRLVEDTES